LHEVPAKIATRQKVMRRREMRALPRPIAVISFISIVSFVAFMR
jgi:hypothetical protein